MAGLIYLSLCLFICLTIVASSNDTPVSLRRCVNFQASYAGSWLAKDTIFREARWRDKAALEFGTRDLYNYAHGHKGSGYKTNKPETDFMVMHLSGIEHGFVRKYGYEKGIALTNITSYKAFEEVLPEAMHIPTNKETLRLWKRTVAVIPFYGGPALVSISKDSSGREVMNATLPSGAGNSHTLAPRSLKLVQLSAVVASVLKYFHTVVVGVVSDSEYNYAVEGLKHLLSTAYDTTRIRVQIIPCGDKSVYLPYRLLTWLQEQHQAGGLETRSQTSSLQFSRSSHQAHSDQSRHSFDYVYYTEADNVVAMRRHDAVANALISFLDDSTYSHSSFVAPQRFEGGRGAVSVNSRTKTTMFDGLTVVGQNDCKDNRGEIFEVHVNGTRNIIPGVPS